MKRNVDLTENEMFKSNPKRINIKMESNLRTMINKPWNTDPYRIYEHDYSRVCMEDKIIYTGNNYRRKDCMLAYEETQGLNHCARCGINIDKIPWSFVPHQYMLCKRCNDELEKEFTNRKPWT